MTDDEMRTGPGAARTALFTALGYQYDRWTQPERRGLRIAPASGSVLRRALAREGFAILAAVVLAENRAAMASTLRAGLLPVATIGWVGIRPLRRPFRRSHRAG